MISCYFTSQAISMEFSSSASDNLKKKSYFYNCTNRENGHSTFILDPLFQNYTFFIEAISLTEDKMMSFNGRTTNNTISLKFVDIRTL